MRFVGAHLYIFVPNLFRQTFYDLVDARIEESGHGMALDRKVLEFILKKVPVHICNLRWNAHLPRVNFDIIKIFFGAANFHEDLVVRVIEIILGFANKVFHAIVHIL